MGLDASAIAEIYDGFCQGKGEATAQVRRWAETVVRAGNWRLSDAEGVVQEVLITLLKLSRAGKVRAPGGFQKLVYTVARFRCVDHYKRDRRRDERETTPADPEQIAGSAGSPDQALEEQDRLQAMVYIIQRLPEACRTIWEQVYREKQTAEKISQELGISVNNFRVRVHRCLEHARRIYRELSALSGVSDE